MGGGLMGKLSKTDKSRSRDIEAVARYRFLDMKRFEINFTWALRFFLPVASMPGVPSSSSFGNTDFGADEFQIAFDKNWVVRYKAFARDAQNSSFKYSPFDLEEPDSRQLQQIAF